MTKKYNYFLPRFVIWRTLCVFFFFLIIISSLDSLFGAHFALFFNQLLYSFSKSEAIVSPLSKIVLLRHSFFVNWKCPHLC